MLLNLKITHEYYGRVNVDIFSQERLILPSVDTRIRLTRSTPQFALIVQSNATATTTAPKPIFKLLDAYLYVRKVKLSPFKHMEIEKSLLTDTAKYLSLIHISEPTRLLSIPYAVFC